MRKIAIFSAMAAAVAFSGTAQAIQDDMQEGAEAQATAQPVTTPETATTPATPAPPATATTPATAGKAEVVAKSANGRAQTVMLNGKEYPVCGGDVTDNCINPREAGLNFGNRALDHWPGKPASEM